MKKQSLLMALVFYIATNAMEEKKTIVLQNDGGYFLTQNTSANEQAREEFNRALQEWQQQMPQTTTQSAYQKQVIERYQKGIISGGFSSLEAKNFVQKIAKKGIVAQAMEQAGYTQGFADLINRHEIEARQIFVDRLASRLKTLKEKTPDAVRDAIRTTFGDKTEQTKSGFISGSLTTLALVGLFYGIKYWINNPASS